MDSQTGQPRKGLAWGSARLANRVQIWTVPRAVYWASDRVRPRWAFLVRLGNLGRRPLYVEKIGISLNAQSGRIRRVLSGKNQSNSFPLRIRHTDQFAAWVTDRCLTPEPPRSVSVQIRLSGGAGGPYRSACRVSLQPCRTLYVRFPFGGKWFTANARAVSHCLGGQFGFDFVAEQDLSLHESPADAKLPCQAFAAFGQPLLAPADGLVVDCEGG